MSTQSVPLHHLPVRSLSAAANMAVDNLLLEQYPQPDAPRFRHYGWSDPSFTFGRTQAYEAARHALPVHTSWQDAHERFASAFQLVRRPTGGGIVDHRSDWTYALVIPASHPLARAKASDVYRDCHRVLVAALAEQGVQAALEPCKAQCAAPDSTSAEPDAGAGITACAEADSAAACAASAKPDAADGSADSSSDNDSVNTDTQSAHIDSAPAESLTASESLADSGALAAAMGESDTDAPAASVCFTHAEPFDVVGEGGVKLAGAAQRRSRDGLLVQGSVSRAEVGGINWQRFERDVAEGFARYLAQSDGIEQSPPQPSSVLVKDVNFPKWPSSVLQAQIAHFASPDWNHRR